MKVTISKSQQCKTLCLAALLGLFSASSMAASYTLNFKDAELTDFVKFVADATGYTVIIDPQVKARIQVLSSKPVNEKELYDLFLSVLETNGFAAVKNGNVMRIMKNSSARTSSVPVEVGERRANSEYVTQIIKLENSNATKLIPVLRPLVPQEGHMAAYQDTNAIIISDTADNVKKIIDIIASIDESSNQDVELIKIKHASVDEVVRIVNQVLNPKAGDPAAIDDRLLLVADSRSHSIVVSASEQVKIRVRALVQQLDTPNEEVGNATVIFLHYASAKDLAPILTKVTQNMQKMNADPKAPASAAGVTAIEAEESTNSLVITADPAVMSSLNAIISKLDKPRAQVLVEAIIVEVIQGDVKSLGFDWLAANEHGGFVGSNQSDGLAGQVALGAFDSDSEDSLKGTATALASVPGSVWGGADFNVKGTSFSAILMALETNGETNVLSTPSLMTLDNNEASIIVGQEVPFVTGSYTGVGGTSSGVSGTTSSSTTQSTVGNPFQTINRQNVGITLKVTPHVNEGDNITLKIVQEVSGIAASDVKTADVVTNERKIETTVTTGDGEVVILGGLIDDDVQESVSKVPILGDLPVIGRLFKKSTTKVRKKNLMVFIRPTVIRNSEKMLEVSKGKYDSIQGIQDYKRARGVDLFDEDVLPDLPEWDKQIETVKKIQAAEAEKLKKEEESRKNSAGVQEQAAKKDDAQAVTPDEAGTIEDIINTDKADADQSTNSKDAQ